MIERTTVSSRINGASLANTCGATCGLTAMTIALAANVSSAGLMRRPRWPSVMISGAGSGSIATMRSNVRPRRCQPYSMAPPILPAPTRTRVPSKSSSDVFIASAPQASLRAKRSNLSSLAHALVAEIASLRSQ
jgi:hypothetical protein